MRCDKSAERVNRGNKRLESVLGKRNRHSLILPEAPTGRIKKEKKQARKASSFFRVCFFAIEFLHAEINMRKS